jgi:HD-like signal output (HDOD) protein
MSKLSKIVIDPKTFLYEHFALSSLPESLEKLHKEIREKDVNLNKVAELIKTDPGLVAQTLKIVNSAYYSLAFEISDVKLAVAYLGVNEIYRVVLSFFVINTLKSEDRESFNEILFHSLLTAFCANHLSKEFEPLLDKNELWCCAVLHDIGKLVYLKFFPKHYKELRKYSLKHGCLFTHAENEYSLPSSSYLGSLLCDRWRLPSMIKQVCSSHSLDCMVYFEEKDKLYPYNTMVSVANLLSVLATDFINEKVGHEISDSINKTLNIVDSKFYQLMSDMVELKEEVYKIL